MSLINCKKKKKKKRKGQKKEYIHVSTYMSYVEVT
jgi:hypothetical protein